MIQTVEAIIDADGRVRLLSEVYLSGPRRALVTVLEEPAAVPGEAVLLADVLKLKRSEEAVAVPGEAALLAEAALAVDWNRPEEDAAWAHLQPAK